MPIRRELLTLWNPSWGFYRLTARGKFIRTLWTGPLMIGVIFCAFYFPCRHVGLPIALPLATAGILIIPWLRQLMQIRAMWRDELQKESAPSDGYG